MGGVRLNGLLFCMLKSFFLMVVEESERSACPDVTAQLKANAIAGKMNHARLLPRPRPSNSLRHNTRNVGCKTIA